MDEVNQAIYDLNRESAEQIANIPLIGKPYLSAAATFCEYVTNPLTIGGDNVGCIAVQQVYDERFCVGSDTGVER